jgi:hypothetical protein
MSVTSIERAKLGYGLGKDEGEAFWLLGMLETIKISARTPTGSTAWSRPSCARATAHLARPP